MAKHDADINLRVDLTEGDITNTANKMAQRIERIFGRSLASGKLSTSTKSLLATLDKGYNRISQLRSELDRLRNTQTNTGEWRAQYARVLNDLKAVNDQMVIYTERAREAKDLGPNLGVWSDFLGGVFNANHGLGRFLATLTRVSTTVAKGGIAILQTILGKIGSAAKAAAKHLGDMTKNLAKSIAGGIVNKLKSLGSAITGIGKKTKDSNNAFKTGFTTLLRYGLGIRSVYFLFRKLRKALGEGIGNLAQYSPAFNTVISNFISSLTQLKNAFATAFAPIINVVAPILTTFINIVSEAVTKVGMLIAALTGQKSFIRAKAVQTDFAASLDKTSDSTNKANKSAEKYKRTLAGFDDVEILKNPDSNSGSGGSGGGSGGGGGTSPSNMFETVAMPSAFEDWAEKIKEAWANADFTELGQILGEKLATALDSIPWDTIKGYAGKFGKSFATFINGLMSVDEDGNSHLAQAIGRTIAEAINTVFTFANQFITNIDPKLVGNFFADLFNSAIKTIDWNLISNTLSEGINNIFSAFESFANKFDFSNLGTTIKDTVVNTLNGLDWTTIHGSVVSVATGLANFINNLFTEDAFSSIATTIARALNAVISSEKAFAIKLDAVKIGKAIGTSINNFFNTFNFESAGVTFGAIVDKLATALSTAIGTVKWQDVGADLQGFLKSVPWGELFGDVSKIAGEVAGALAGLVAGLFGGLPQAISDYFADKKNQYGGSILYGIIGGIGEAVENIARWIIDNIFKPFIDGFKEAFGIHSPASAPELIDAAKNIGLGILNGIAEPFINIAKWVKERILDPIMDAFDNADKTVGDILDFLKGGKETVVKTVKVTIKKIINKAGEAWEFVKSGAETIVKTVQTIFEKLGNWKDEAWSAFKSGKESVKKTVEAAFKKIGDWSSDAWNILKSGAETVKKTVETTFKKVGDWTGDAWSVFNSGTETVKKTVELVLTKIGDWSEDAWTLFKAGAETVKKTVQVAIEKANTWVDDAWNILKSGTETIVKTIQTVYEEASGNEANDMPENSEQNITTTITLKKHGWTTIANFVGTAVSVAISLWKNGWTKISEWIGNAVSVGISLWHNGWSSISKWVGTAVSVGIKLWKDGWSKLSKFVGTAVSVGIKLWKDGWKSISSWIGTKVSVGVKLWKDGWKSISSWIGTKVSVGVSLIKKGASWLWNLLHKARGGVFANGGWRSIAQYASGGVPNRGTMFVAGEAGAEAVGHINGRTEVLNQSQMAAVMYTAVLNGTASLMKTITGHMTICTNTVIANIGSLLSAVNFTTSQIYDITNLVNRLNVGLTDIVNGKVVPTKMSGDNAELMRALNTIIQNQNNVVTRSEIQEILTDAFRRYMNIDFYLGDEQVARHANAGNLKLNRRYGTV